MAWTVHLEDETGKPVTQGLLILERGLLPRDASSPISALIEASPYYDTVLNPIQAEAFLVEIEAVRSNYPLQLAPLRALVEQATFPHAYLRFVGD